MASPTFLAQPATEADLDSIRHLRQSTQGTLSAPLIDAVMPAADDDARAAVRSAWSADQQLDTLRGDPTALFVKAVDVASGEMVALARWHRYDTPVSPYYGLEYAGAKAAAEDASYPEGVSAVFIGALLGPLIDVREHWQVPGPRYVLTTIKTREPWRRRGAAGALLDWGLSRAREEGVPAYLEAMEGAVSLYKSKGFKIVRPETVDCSPAGVDVKFTVQLMVANAD